MPSNNGHSSKRTILYVILYARVSSEEQAKNGYSLAQQIEALREYAAREGYEVLEEVLDPGQSGASLERPGMDRVRDLVAAGGVSLVLAQDRDRFAREPAYHYLLREAFAEHGCKLEALNDRGDDSPEGELADGMLDLLAEFQQAQTARSSRRGRLRKARKGKIVAGPSPAYGFRYTEDREGYEVDEAKMRVVRRIFKDVVAGKTLRSITKRLDDEGVPTPGHARLWGQAYIKQLIAHDAYRPHTYEDVKALVSAEVASRLDPNESYGIWWFGRKRHHGQRAENGPDGRTYHKTRRRVPLEREKWIDVPVPDSGISRELVDAARERVKDNRPAAKSGARFWELSGGIGRCASCGRAVSGTRVNTKGRPARFYYRCPNRAAHGPKACPNGKNHRAEMAEAGVWEEVSSLLKEPERLRVGIERYIEQEHRGDPERELRVWAKRLADVEAKRSRYQDMAAEGLIDFDELRAKLDALDTDRKTAARELEAVRNKAERLSSLKLKTEALTEAYSRKARLGWTFTRHKIGSTPTKPSG